MSYWEWMKNDFRRSIRRNKKLIESLAKKEVIETIILLTLLIILSWLWGFSCAFDSFDEYLEGLSEIFWW
jgi:hypothetical protein